MKGDSKRDISRRHISWLTLLDSIFGLFLILIFIVFRPLLPEEYRYGAHHTAERNVWTEAFADTREFPEDAEDAGFVSID